MKYSIKIDKGKIILEGAGKYNNTPLKIEITFDEPITQKMIDVAYTSILKILNTIHINTKMINNISNTIINHGIFIKINIIRQNNKISMSAEYKLKIINNNYKVASIHEVNFTENERIFIIKFTEITDTIAKIVASLITSPIKVYTGEEIIKLKKILYLLMMSAGPNKEIKLKHKLNTNNVIITIKHLNTDNKLLMTIINFNDLISINSKEQFDKRILKINKQN